MKRATLFFVVFIASATLVAQDRAKPTVQECKADLSKWVPMFKAAYADSSCAGDGTPSCPFAPSIKDLNVGQLSYIVARAEACTKADRRRRRYYYQRVATRAENIVVMRTAYFLLSENQTDRYAEWERAQQQMSSPETPTKTDSDELPTVGKSQPNLGFLCTENGLFLCEAQHLFVETIG